MAKKPKTIEAVLTMHAYEQLATDRGCADAPLYADTLMRLNNEFKQGELYPSTHRGPVIQVENLQGIFPAVEESGKFIVKPWLIDYKKMQGKRHSITITWLAKETLEQKVQQNTKAGHTI